MSFTIKLVAVAMSAMLAAGMLPVGAYAEELTAGDEVAEVYEEVLDDSGAGWWVVKDSLVWDYDNLTVVYDVEQDAQILERKAAAVNDEESYLAATCTAEGSYRLKAKLADE